MATVDLRGGGVGAVGEWRGEGVEVVKGRSKWVEMGEKVCVLKVQRWRENGGQQTCICTHTCTRTRKHIYINTRHTYAHARTRTHAHTYCEVVDLSDDGPVEDQLGRVALLPVQRARAALPNQLLDAAAAERVAALDRDDGLAEHALAGRADKGRRLLHKLGRLGGHLSAVGEEGGPASGSGGLARCGGDEPRL